MSADDLFAVPSWCEVALEARPDDERDLADAVAALSRVRLAARPVRGLSEHDGHNGHNRKGRPDAH